jgi:hypothetical protein
MRLGMVRSLAGEPSVAVERDNNGGWVPLLTVPGADQLGPARTDLLAYWAAFPSPRLPFVDRMMPHPAPRRIAARLPERLQPAAQRYGLVARIGADGTILNLKLILIRPVNPCVHPASLTSSMIRKLSRMIRLLR